MELWHVAGCKPHELTQQFVQGALANQHAAPWQDETTRLYRFFEFVQTTPIAKGVMPGGRVPGKVNLNGVWNVEVFKALCDAQAGGGNSFTEAEVAAVFATMLRSRSPAATVGGPPVLQPTDSKLAGLARTGVDRPFWPLSLGPGAGGDALSANARGIDNTLFRKTVPASGIAPAPVFDVPNKPSPYQTKELLTKIFPSVTTRSNVFAVWLTVGFFKVEDDTVRPVRLGAEIGKSENRQVRHRMFAIVDRTQLRAFATNVKALTGGTTGVTNVVAGRNNLAPPAGGVADSRTGRKWTLQAGNWLVLQPNTNTEETVLVQRDSDTNTLFFIAARDHLSSAANGDTVWVRGNPGPWTRYDPRSDTAVVPYFAVID
jgi:hypothetical protein